MDYISGATASPEKLSWLDQYLPKQAGKALDLGCGAGFYSKHLLEKGWTVEALDLTPNKNLKGVNVQQHDLEKGLPHSNSCFNLVLAWDVLEHVKAESNLWMEISRTLNTGGILVGSVPHASCEELYRHNLTYKHHIDKTHQREYNFQDLKQRMKNNGFDELSMELKGPVSPQFLSEFITIKAARKPVNLMIGAARRLGLLSFGELYADIFFAARKE
jgi:SAM-dependent methyltransferase